MTSELAKRLIDDLLLVGKKYGFDVSKEEEILTDSDFKVDVFWKIPMPDTTFFPNINVACIEVQYSKAPHSITHNLCKSEVTLHPATHYIISYNKISQDHLIILRREIPAGLVIVDGEEEVRKLNLWITRFLTLKSEEAKIEEAGKRMLRFVIDNKSEKDELKLVKDMREAFAMEIKKVFVPPEVSSLLEFVKDDNDIDRESLDSAYQAFIEFVQGELIDNNIVGVEIPANLLFQKGMKIDDEAETKNVEFERSIEIKQSNVIVRDAYGIPYEIFFKKGTVYVDSEIGVLSRESLTPDALFSFLTKASVIIENTLRQYSLTSEEKDKLDAIIKAFGN